jgi:alpha-amylase/alpha-mannosidase (GH57 family)
MAKLTFLWHLHQPQYRTADGRVHAPWVLLHAAGEYLTLIHALEAAEWPGHVVNLSPVFLEQLAAYRDGAARDPLLDALRTPARDLGPEAVRELLRWSFMLGPRQLDRVPRVRELEARSRGAQPAELARLFTAQDLTDLQVLLVLAYALPNARWHEAISDLARHGRDFSDAARAQAVGWLEQCPGRALDGYARLARRPGIEISTSPWAHPIVPLLLGTAANARAQAGAAAPSFRAEADAAEQIRLGFEAMRAFGFTPAGCWPPEGAVSEAAVALYGTHGARWLASDEGILAASLGRPLTGEWGVSSELFAPWRIADDGPVLFFRHRGLSDFISFQAARLPDEATAARELADALRALAGHLDESAGILIALDGENPWTSLREGGAGFLATLAHELAPATRLRPSTLSERVAAEPPRHLARLHAGSWINASFSTWIGHPEKNRGWELLAAVQAAGGDRGGRSWLAAEGSDWWWWLGDDNPTQLAPLYDRLLREHLADACRLAGVVPPAELAAPIRSAAIPLRVPLSRGWPLPRLDGLSTSYFEWSISTWVDAPEPHRGIARAALRAAPGQLCLRVDPPPGAPPPAPLVVTLIAGERRHAWRLPDDLPGSSAVGHVVEAVLPLPEGEVLLAIEHKGDRLPTEGYWRLALWDVDEP